MASSGEEFGSTIIPKKRAGHGSVKPLPSLTVIAHPNPARIGDRVQLHALARAQAVEISRATPAFTQPGRAIGRPLADPFISREPVFLRPGTKGTLLLDPGTGKIPLILGDKHAAATTSISPAELRTGIAIVLAERVVMLLHETEAEMPLTASDYGMVGYSGKVCSLRREIERVADLDTPVLLRGASGTGKELVARAIHEKARPDKPFVSVNMGAIPASLAASELFGVVKGSFTGSMRDQTGYFRAAHEGTLFLDEIGETGSEIQVMLLRALETGEISPVGSQSPIRVRTRLIAATDSNLEAKIAADTFKSPLFHRLAGYEIRLPSLRERKEDIGRLFVHFAAAELAAIGEGDRLKARGPSDEPWLPAQVMLRLLNYDWPGNIRQLRNAVRQLVIGCRGERNLHMVPSLEHLLSESAADTASQTPAEGKGRPLTPRRKPKTIAKDELVDQLKANRWDIKATAEALGVSRGALYLLIEKTPGLQKASELSAAAIEASLQAHAGDVDEAAADLGVSSRALRRRLNALDSGSA